MNTGLATERKTHTVSSGMTMFHRVPITKWHTIQEAQFALHIYLSLCISPVQFQGTLFIQIMCQKAFCQLSCKTISFRDPICWFYRDNNTHMKTALMSSTPGFCVAPKLSPSSKLKWITEEVQLFFFKYFNSIRAIYLHWIQTSHVTVDTVFHYLDSVPSVS